MIKTRSILSWVLVLIMVVTLIPMTASADSLLFKDVPSDAWYYNDVKAAYEAGLINGYEDNTFRPDANMTYAQAVKLAACMNQKYTTGSVMLSNGSPNWYDSYVTYAKDNNIINKDYDWDTTATRAGYVEIFAKALPDEALAPMNTVVDGAIPDVAMSHPQAAVIYNFYRVGILTGNDGEGTFLPNNNIARREVAAILTRMMNESARKSITLTKQLQNSASLYEIEVNRIYSNYDITGDGKADKIKIAADNDAEGYISEIALKVNDKDVLTKVYSSGEEAKYITGRVYPEIKLIRLICGQPLLYIHFSTSNGYYAGGWVYMYESGEILQLLDTRSLVERYAASNPNAWRIWESLDSVTENTLVFSVGSFSTDSIEYNCEFVNGVLVLENY